MKENFVCLITGPAGVGKSSVTKALAKKFTRSAVINLDQLHAMVVGGYVKPWPHTEEVDLQLSLSAKNACEIANNFLEKGFNVFIDDLVGRKLLEQYSEHFKNDNFKTFLLLPSLESLLKRFDERENKNNEELRKRTQDLHKSFSEKKDKLNWKVIDSSGLTLEETVDQIYKELLNTN
ncbi:MAG: AAA family ATPase [Patescibacteria group bacterium]